MSVAGSDNLADAPTLTVGTASAYTPNTGYGLETGEPSALSGRTAWWRLAPSVGVINWVDALYSQTASGAAASTRVWVYITDSEAPGFADLTLLVAGGTDERVGFVGSGSFDYYVRVDTASTAPVSYCVALGVEQYDQIVARYPLGGTYDDPDPSDGNPVVDGHFTTNASLSGPPDYLTTFAAAVAGNTDVGNGDPLTLPDDDDVATLDTSGFYEATFEDYGTDVLLILVGTSAGYASIVPPAAEEFELVGASVVIVGAATVAQSLRHAAVTNTLPIFVGGIQAEGSSDVVFGDLAEHVVSLQGTHDPGTLLEDYNAHTLNAQINPYDFTLPTPQGTWQFAYLGIEFAWQSIEPLPYEPPPAPPLAVLVEAVTRQFPRDDPYGLGSAPRIIPPPRRGRVVGGYQ